MMKFTPMAARLYKRAVLRLETFPTLRALLPQLWSQRVIRKLARLSPPAAFRRKPALAGEISLLIWHARDVAARPRQWLDQTAADRVGCNREHDRDGDWRTSRLPKSSATSIFSCLKSLEKFGFVLPTCNL
jgi:hypothetical protein